MADLAPVDIEQKIANPDTYEDTILKIFAKKRLRGMAYGEAANGVTYFSTASGRQDLARAIAKTVAGGEYKTQTVGLWILETKGKRRAAHSPEYVDHVVGSALAGLLTHNAQCYGMPGVYSYLPHTTNVSAARGLAKYVRAHRQSAGPRGGPLYVLQSDFEHYGDNLPVGPDAALWPILRAVAALGSPSGTAGPNTLSLLTALTRPVVRDSEGSEFNRLRGLPMGTPLVPILSNLAVVPMDRAILDIDGIFYARYNDDFLIAHPELEALHEADKRIDSLTAGLGVKRKMTKERRTALSGNGQTSQQDPAYRGANRIDYIGLSVTHAGTTAVAPHRLRRFVARIATRIDGMAPALHPLPVRTRARHLVDATNVMLDLTNQFAAPGLSSLLDSTTDRGILKDVDFRIARKIVQAATGKPGVLGFRTLAPSLLYRDLNLTSIVQLRNLH